MIWYDIYQQSTTCFTCHEWCFILLTFIILPFRQICCRNMNGYFAFHGVVVMCLHIPEVWLINEQCSWLIDIVYPLVITRICLWYCSHLFCRDNCVTQLMFVSILYNRWLLGWRVFLSFYMVPFCDQFVFFSWFFYWQKWKIVPKMRVQVIWVWDWIILINLHWNTAVPHYCANFAPTSGAQ